MDQDQSEKAEDIKEIKNIVSDLTFDGTMSSDQISPSKNKVVNVDEVDVVDDTNNQRHSDDSDDHQVVDNTNDVNKQNEDKHCEKEKGEDQGKSKDEDEAQNTNEGTENKVPEKERSMSSITTQLTDNRESKTKAIASQEDGDTVVPEKDESNMTSDKTTMPTTTPKSSPDGKRKNTEEVKVSIGDLKETTTSSHNGRIRVGICAMDKKAKSKPMGEILARLDKNIFEIVLWGDEMIHNVEVEKWPLCDVLIAFHSSCYPLEKAEKYAELHPDIFILNDLKMQRVLMDRRRVYDLLEASGIDVPRHVFMNRDGYVPTMDLLNSASNQFTNNNDTASIISNNTSIIMSEHDGEDECDLVEHDDHIEVNGVVIHKPFVEKPVDADDHNIAIYYPYSAGGGCKKLFRKIGDRSSEFYPHINEVRRDGSYIYEEYVETQGIDVKMYTVGPDYGHAEARKSPTVDGKVERNADGKEVRFPVILTLREKEIARRIVTVFKQLVCGFDLLRVQEGDSLVSYVCDVNGWSFVKKSKKYYDDCAQILTEHMLAARKPVLHHGFSALDPLLTKVRDASVDTPMRRKHQKTFSRSSSKSYADANDDQNSTTPPLENTAVTLAEGAAPVRQIPDMLMDDPASSSMVTSRGDEDTVSSKSTGAKQGTRTHHEELLCVQLIVRHGDRTPKQKLKVKMSEPQLLKYFHDHAENFKKELKVKDKIPMTQFLQTIREMIKEKQAVETNQNNSSKNNDILNKLLHMRDVLERWNITGLNRKLQMKPTKWDEYINADGIKILKCSQLQLILKWGGNLTKLGEKQAINLGKRLRQELYPDETGGGILRLHSTFRHDLKIKTSDEGRVMKTAAAFAKGLLELEGEITPILVSLVHKERNSHHMLDPSGNKEVKKELEECKVEVNRHLQKDFNIDGANAEMLEEVIGPSDLKSIHHALRQLGNPRKTLFAMRATIGHLLQQLDEMLGVITSDMENKFEGGEGLKGDEDIDEALSGIKLYKGETLLELTERWRLLYNKMYDEENDEFDLSRVPDVHDNVRFDMLHNPHLGLTSTLEKLYEQAKLMADCVVPQEYGTTIAQKRSIANKMCGALLDKLLTDLVIARTDNQVDMRYMINLQYSADLPINTMGRRVRTRLYFTSESHLHTLLNVLRFASTNPSSKAKNPLSSQGIEIVSSAPELCYLTQIAIRLFENTSKEIDNPKRFRIEIFFSPGATATPLHMSELEKDKDTSRFDTEPLKLISRTDLSCKDLEEYIHEAIEEGKVEDEEDDFMDHSAESKKAKDKITNATTTHPQNVEVVSNNEEVTNEKTTERIKFVTISEEKNTHISFADDSAHSTLGEDYPLIDDELESQKDQLCGEEQKLKAQDLSAIAPSVEKDKCKIKESRSTSSDKGSDTTSEKTKVSEEDDNDTNDQVGDDDKLQEMAVVLARQYFWTSVAAISFVLGIGCLILSREIVETDFKMRRWTRR